MQAIEIGEHVQQVAKAIRILPNVFSKLGLHEDGKTSIDKEKPMHPPMDVRTPQTAQEVLDVISKKLKLQQWMVSENNARMENLRIEITNIQCPQNSDSLFTNTEEIKTDLSPEENKKIEVLSFHFACVIHKHSKHWLTL
jgi:hypothetical protein